MASILIVEDEGSLRKALGVLLRSAGYEVGEVRDGEGAFSILRKNKFDLVLTDLMMKKVTGEEVLRRVKQISPETEVVIITGFGTIQSAVECIKAGAFDYITKPFKTEEILKVIDKALEKREALDKVEVKSEENGYTFEDIIYTSRGMEKIIHLIKKVAPTDITILIEGESGTGKELLARAVHKNSLRKDGPIVTVNCSSLPETLLESELFGYTKGAFTGALTDKKGLFEIADSGTIFLDEIGDTSLALQMRFLRSIQEKEIRKVGGEEFTKVDVRLIAATNKSLVTLVKEGKFREDLYYRINVMPIFIPPLRERKEDIVPLANHFVNVYAERYQKNVKGIDEEIIIRELENYSWPGNVRELEHTIERGVALASSDLDKTSLLFLPEDENLWLPETELKDGYTLKENEKVQIIKILKKNKWNYTISAEELGISRTTLWRRMKEYGLREDS
jgi:DNA-binding NtrC family response regulator